jgi:hypothetical protein
MTISVHEANMHQHFGNTDEPISHNGTVSVDWLHTAISKKEMETGAREYQREKVASVRWKQNILRTVLVNVHARIPQIHIRVVRLSSDSYSFEVIDGQQRVTALVGYLNGEFPLPDKMFTNDQIDVGGMYVTDLKKTAPAIYERIKAHRVTCVWYENLDDDQVSRIFVEVLNNVNSMRPQEIRNAIRGLLSSYIRNRVRFEDQHELFTRITTGHGKTQKTYLKYLPKLSLKGRMEADEWFTQLIYLNEFGAENGIKGQTVLTNWIRDAQLPGEIGAIGSRKFTKLQNRCEELLKFAFKVISSVNDTDKHHLTPMVAMTLVLYGTSLQKKGYSVGDDKTFTKAYFNVIEKWSDTKKKLYANHTTTGGGHLPPMIQLFGGKNENAFKTIFWILNKELSESGEDAFGLISLDPRASFTEQDIIKKWKEQDYKCFYTGRPLNEDELVGDHYIPRSWGIKRGGVTEYENLVVTDAQTNLQKTKMHGDDFIKMREGTA